MIDSCPICGNKMIEKTPTKISEFVAERIKCDADTPVDLCQCRKCSFAFYDYRFSEKEEVDLYSYYRNSEYQKQREKSECWYTKKVNDALNNDKRSLLEQKKTICEMLDRNGFSSFKNGLDYGGNEGATFTKRFGTENRYVYDISDCDVLKGMKKISSVEEAVKLDVDFVMCNMVLEHSTDPAAVVKTLHMIGSKDAVFYAEVPSEYPFIKNKFSLKNNVELLLNPVHSKIKLAKYYFKLKNEPFMPMKEHINFYTERSLCKLFETNGFEVLDVQDKKRYSVLGSGNVISILLKKI